MEPAIVDGLETFLVVNTDDMSAESNIILK